MEALIKQLFFGETIPAPDRTANLVLLDRDLLFVPPEELREIRVRTTYRADRHVFPEP